MGERTMVNQVIVIAAGIFFGMMGVVVVVYLMMVFWMSMLTSNPATPRPALSTLCVSGLPC